MSRYTRSSRRLAIRAAVTAALGLAVAGVAVVPAHAGPITEWVGTYGTLGDCMYFTQGSANNHHANGWYCVGTDGYIYWD